MTFEEFFNKKRINVELLRDADPALYSEFKSHFELMGEKSFDHTKKFWFNKLRHLYHLAEPVKKAVTQLETQIAAQAEPLSSPTMEQNVPPAQAVSQQEAKLPASPKPAFRPRNIPSAAAQTTNKPTQEEPDKPVEKPAALSGKPGFKPRNVKPVSGELSDDAQKTASRPGQDIPSGASQGNTANIPRPAYKPRFNAGKVSDKVEKDVEVPNNTVEDTPSSPPAAASADVSSSTPEHAKPAYKPRFNLKNIAAQESPSESQKQSNDNPEATDKTTAASEDQATSDAPEAPNTTVGASSKPAYKPRFNIKTIAQKNPGDAGSLASNELAENTGAENTGADNTAPSETDIPEADQPESTGSATPKPAYKPRFNVKTVVFKVNEEPPVLPASESLTGQESSVEHGLESAEEPPQEGPKPAYKPRFNIKNIKPKE